MYEYDFHDTEFNAAAIIRNHVHGPMHVAFDTITTISMLSMACKLFQKIVFNITIKEKLCV